MTEHAGPAGDGDEDRPRGSQGSGLSDQLVGVAVGALKSLGTAAGVATFVAVTGGAITWVRFHSVGIPADQAVAKVPREQLLVIGSVSAVAFLLVGVLAVLAVFVLDEGGIDSRRSRFGLFGLATLEAVAVVVLAGGLDGWIKVLLAMALASTGVTSALLLLDDRFSAPVPETRKAVPTARKAVPTAGEPVQRSLTWPWGILTQAAVVVVPFVLVALQRNWWVLAAVSTAGLLAVANVGVARATGNRFLWYGVAVFFSVAVFGAVTNAVRTFLEPEAQAVAVLLKSSPPTGITGLYVAETDKRLYLGRVCARPSADEDKPPERQTGRLLWVEREDVLEASIGSLQGLRSAQAQAEQLLTELEGSQVSAEGAGSMPPSRTSSSGNCPDPPKRP